MSETDGSKGLWGRLTGANSSQESVHRGKSLDTKFADPSFLSGDEPGFPQALSQKTGQQPIPSTGAPFGLSKLFGGSAGSVPGAASTSSPVKAPVLKPIKTPHNEPISHPELAFSPSDIGVWEINKSKKGGGWFS